MTIYSETALITYSMYETKTAYKTKCSQTEMPLATRFFEIRQNGRYRKEQNLTQQNIYKSHIRA